MNLKLLILFVLVANSFFARSQENTTTFNKITNFPNRFIDKVSDKAASLEAKLDRQTEKYLQRLLKKERKLQRQLSKIDSTAARDLFSNTEQQYAVLTSPRPSLQVEREAGVYLPYVDSLKTSLSFLQQNSELLGGTKDLQQKITGSLEQVKGLQSKLQQTEQVKAFIRQRKEQIKATLSRYTNLPKGITKSYNDFNKEFYYYSQQVKEYRDILNDPDKLTQKALSLLNRLDGFQKFMQQHSELAGLFGPLPASPGGAGGGGNLAGLQTRAQVQQLVQTQLAAGPNTGSGPQQLLQQNLQAAQAQLNQLKEKLLSFPSAGGGQGDADMPNFKPNNQKIKSFLKRLEYGTNLQTTKSSYFFPTTTDLGLSVGYKLTDKNTIGIGISYKAGWGKDIRHIAVTSEGMGLRSFFDIKLKGSFYASGGFEYNLTPGPSPQVERGMAWQQSGLVGISKILSFPSSMRGRPGGGLFKKTKLQLLWDFLSYRQVPRTQAVKFRVGYNF